MQSAPLKETQTRSEGDVEAVRSSLKEWLDGEDDSRLKALAARKQRYVFCAPLIALANAALWLFGLWSDETGIQGELGGATIAVLIGLHYFAQKPVKAFKKRVKAHILGVLSAQFGLTYSLELAGKDHERKFAHAGLVPASADRVHYEDEFEGAVDGVPIRLFECKMEEQRGSGRRSDWVTLFEGMMVEIVFNQKSFHGHTLIVPNGGVLSSLRRSNRGLERAKLEDPLFEDMFDVYSSDQVEARYLLTPSFMERIRRLSGLFKGKPLHIAFVNGRLLFALDVREPLFEVSDISAPLSENETLAKMEEELQIFQDVIQGLNLTSKTRI